MAAAISQKPLEPHVSCVNKGFAFDANTWAVSLLNSGSNLVGHAIILVEGIKDQALFVGQYDMKAKVVLEETGSIQNLMKNYQGVINQIDIHEASTYGRDYSSMPGRTWHGTAEKVDQMIKNIHQMRNILESSIKQGVYPYKYQGAGSESVLPGNGGDNCVTWAEKKLAIAGLGNGVKPLDPWKAHPAVHAAGGNTSCTVM
jgi:hypothetical protein